jgi:hypothetical protein
VVTEQPRKTKRNVDRRLEFIDYRLYWLGHVNRSDLIDFFGVSVPQASADLAQYQAEAVGNAVYDKTRKTYVPGPQFEPKFFEPSADQYLAELRLMEAGILDAGEAWAVRLPILSVAPILRRRIAPETLRSILTAIRTKLSLKVSYQSMSATEPKTRWISPHALGFDGYRWHARAWCHTRNKFADFVLARVLKVSDSRPSDIDAKNDAPWNREVTMKLVPHPALKDGKRKAVELDFGMTHGSIEVKARLCLTYYIERQFGLDHDPSTVEPERQQIVLENRRELVALRKELGDDWGHHEEPPS